MITSTTVTEPLRAEHRALRPQLAELANAAASVWGWDATQAIDRLRKIVAFLQDHLVPHAAAEEAVLYPAIEEAMGAPGATATMQADHIEIVARSERLAATVDAAAERWPDPAVVDDIAIQLAGLSAIIELHFRKEEDVLLPVLDRTLSAEAADALFARMGHAAHGR
jgi:iron-sulfur cluster repair protein YtfE (RIC family)